MTTLTYHYSPAPRQGILLNSPTASPAFHPASLPALVPSNSSLSSSASSSAPGDTSDYFPTKSASPSPGPSHTHPSSHHNAHSHPKSRNGSNPSTVRRITFAPLPQPRRDEDESLYSPVFTEDDDTTSEHLTMSSALAAAGTSLADSKPSPRLPRSALPPDSLLLDPSHPLSDIPESQPVDAHRTTAPSDCGQDWDVVPGSPALASLPLPSPDSPRKSKKWSKVLKPFLGRSSGIARSLSAEEAAAMNGDALRGRGCAVGGSRDSSGSREASLTRERRASDFGSPLHRWTSEGPSAEVPLNKKKFPSLFGAGGASVPLERTQSLTSLSGRDDKKAKAPPAKAGRPTIMNGGRKQQRMLNGRVYGAKRNANPFANVRYGRTFACLTVLSHIPSPRAPSRRSLSLRCPPSLFCLCMLTVLAAIGPTSPSSSSGATAAWVP